MENDAELLEVTELAHTVARLAATRGGVTVRPSGAEDAPLVLGRRAQLSAQLRALLTDLLATTPGEVSPRRELELSVDVEPAAGAPSWLHLRLSLGGASRHLCLPVAGAVSLDVSGGCVSAPHCM